jgi:hypothetical protein
MACSKTAKPSSRRGLSLSQNVMVLEKCLIDLVALIFSTFNVILVLRFLQLEFSI